MKAIRSRQRDRLTEMGLFSTKRPKLLQYEKYFTSGDDLLATAKRLEPKR